MKAQRALLDSLMGGFRNEDLSDREVVKWSDDKVVCRYQLVSFCPYQVFEEARQEVGRTCEKDHGEYLRMAYEKEASDKVKRRYEQRLLSHLRHIIYEVDCKIRREKRRLGILEEDEKDKEKVMPVKEPIGPQLVTLPEDNAIVAFSDSQKARLDEIEKELQEKNERMERLDVERNKELSQQLVETLEALSKEKNDLIKRAKEQADWVAPEEKFSRVCESCGAILDRWESNNRSQRHLNGRIHLAYVKTREVVKELEKREQARRDLERAKEGGKTDESKVLENDNEKTLSETRLENSKEKPKVLSHVNVEVIENKKEEREAVVKEGIGKYSRSRSAKVSAHRKREFSPSGNLRNERYQRRQSLSRGRESRNRSKQRSQRPAGSSEWHRGRTREEDRGRRARNISEERILERRRREEYRRRREDPNQKLKGGYRRGDEELRQRQDEYRRRENLKRREDDSRQSRDNARCERDDYYRHEHSREKRGEASRSRENKIKREESRSRQESVSRKHSQNKLVEREVSRNREDPRGNFDSSKEDHARAHLNTMPSEQTINPSESQLCDDRKTEPELETFKERKFSSSPSRTPEESEPDRPHRNESNHNKDASDRLKQKEDRKVRDERREKVCRSRERKSQKRSRSRGKYHKDHSENRRVDSRNRSERRGKESHQPLRMKKETHKDGRQFSTEGRRRSRSRSRSRVNAPKVRKKYYSDEMRRSCSKTTNRRKDQSELVGSKKDIVTNRKIVSPPQGRRRSSSKSRSRRKDEKEMVENRKREFKRDKKPSLDRKRRCDSRSRYRKNGQAENEKEYRNYERDHVENIGDERGKRKVNRNEAHKSERKSSPDGRRRPYSRSRNMVKDHRQRIENKRDCDKSERYHSAERSRRLRSRSRNKIQDHRQYVDTKSEDYKAFKKYSPEYKRRSRSRSRNRRKNQNEHFRKRREDDIGDKKSFSDWRRRSRPRLRNRASRSPRSKDYRAIRYSGSRTRARRSDRISLSRMGSSRFKDYQPTKRSRGRSRETKDYHTTRRSIARSRETKDYHSTRRSQGRSRETKDYHSTRRSRDGSRDYRPAR